MSVPLPPSARLPPVSLSLFVSPNPSFTDSAERTQPANQTPQAVGFLCGRVGYLDVGRFSITCLFRRRSASWLGTTGHRSDHLPTQTLFYHVPMNAQGLNLSGVAPPPPPPPSPTAPQQKKQQKTGNLQGLRNKGFDPTPLFRSVLPFQVSVRVLRIVSSCLLEQIGNYGTGNLYGVIVNKLVRILFFVCSISRKVKTLSAGGGAVPGCRSQ